jgi:hypothetical protein
LEDYDPQIGRFVQVDPITDRLSAISPYEYALNDPVTYIDKYGLIGGVIPCPGTSAFSIFLSSAGAGIVNTLQFASAGINIASMGLHVSLATYSFMQSAQTNNLINNQITTIQVGVTIATGEVTNNPCISNSRDPDDNDDNSGISIASGGFNDLDLDVTFNVTDVDADGLQIIQTFEGTRGDDGKRVGKMIINDDGVNYDAFVDRGKYLPYVTEDGNEPAHRTKPYFQDASDNIYYVAFDKSKKSGSLRMHDEPTGVRFHKTEKFETIIIATNYKGTGKNYVLGAFKWGFKNHGNSAIHNRIKLNKTVSPTTKKIIAHDYPNYKFYNQ